MMSVVRFAPSPTGLIHIGNARTAVLNWLLAQKAGGKFILRYDDTDIQRSKPAYVEAIAQDLAWLGITPSNVAFQSHRFDKYAEAAETLKATGRLYPAYETADELERRRKRQLARHQPPIYDRAALKLTAADKAALEAQGLKPHWRFKLDHHMVEWDDMIRGVQQIDTRSLSDPVLIREDGSYLYTLPSVVDDIEFGITHVIRGEDHVVNTAVQIEITRALGGTLPHYAHHSLLVGADGAGLSKRLGSLSITAMREAGLEPMAVASLAALLGTSDSIVPYADYGPLIQGFDLAKLSRAPARFDEADLRHLNAKLLHHLNWHDVAQRLPYGNEELWLAVRGNLERLEDAKLWYDIVYGQISPVILPEDIPLIAVAVQNLPPEPWGPEIWKSWTTAISLQTGLKGKQLFMPLRRALTGLDHGPELGALLPLMGRERVLLRLK